MNTTQHTTTKTFLEFCRLPKFDFEKTHTYEILSKGTLIGYIKWHSRWRRFTFQPLGHTIFDVNCLLEIVEFIKDLMQQRKHDKLSKESQDTQERKKAQGQDAAPNTQN